MYLWLKIYFLSRKKGKDNVLRLFFFFFFQRKFLAVILSEKKAEKYIKYDMQYIKNFEISWKTFYVTLSAL